MIRAALEKEVAALVEEGYTRFVDGGADGFDLLAASVVLDYKRKHGGIELWFYVPYPSFYLGWSRHARILRYQMLQAKEIIITEQHGSRWAPLARDRQMVQESDLCVAYLLPGQTRGGTLYTVGCARNKGIPVINLAEQLNT